MAALVDRGCGDNRPFALNSFSVAPQDSFWGAPKHNVKRVCEHDYVATGVRRDKFFTVIPSILHHGCTLWMQLFQQVAPGPAHLYFCPISLKVRHCDHFHECAIPLGYAHHCVEPI